ncbi:integration host factor, actinobacterial type [Pseudonocardia hispaniensis]|uniref:Integration host factor, actinobacterial type n=1 Tax=Pseudonocardia hispaniensis TaxID=904933 RepID=A0ABW1J785_9PSEU
MALPTLTPEQRQEALKKAAAARTARKELRDAIARGDQTIPEVLSRAKSDAIVGKTKVADLLKSLPGYGPAKVNALLERTGIDASRRAAGLGERQREALLNALK